MGKELKEIAKELISKNKKVQLIYAFNGTGKTRLSRAFKEEIVPPPRLCQNAGSRKKWPNHRCRLHPLRLPWW